MTTPKQITLNFQKEKLVISENAWRPNSKTKMSELKSFLNKFTPEKREILSNKIVSLMEKFDENEIKEATGYLFDYSHHNVNFISLYSELVSLICSNVKEVRKHILKLCQEQFRNTHFSTNVMIFIGELYNVDIIPEKIIKFCLAILMKNFNTDEENFTATCKFIETITPKYNTEDEIKTLNNIEKFINSRCKFMALDLLEKRDSKKMKPKTIYEIRHSK